MLATTQSWTGQELDNGRYLILSLLNQGPLAELYLAHDTATGDRLVIKTPLPERMQQTDLATRFAAEMEVLRTVDHPSIIRVSHFGQHQGRPYWIMPFYAGGDLALRLGKASEHPYSALQSWLPTIAGALHHMHKQRHLHCNVKPTNILFDEQGQAFLADLGMARLLWEDGKTTPHTVLAGRFPGTPRYMAPEQLQRTTLDFRTDLFALAVTVYEAVTGVCPFPGEDPVEVHNAQQWHGCRLAIELNPAFPAQPAGILQKALELEPHKRYPSCHTFATELLAALAAVSKASTFALASNNTTANFEDFGIELDGADLAPPPDLAGPAPPVMEPQPIFLAPERLAEPTAPSPSRARHGWFGFCARSFVLLVLLAATAMAGSIFLPGTPLQAMIMAPLDEWFDLPHAAAEPKPVAAHDGLETERLSLQAREQKIANQLKQWQETQTKLKQAEDKLKLVNDEFQFALTGKQDLAKDLTSARLKLHEAVTAKNVVAKERDQALARIAQAEEQARTAEQKALNMQASLNQAQGEAGHLENKLKAVEKSVKESWLWFVISNPNNSTLYYETRILTWNGDWSVWKSQQLKGPSRIKMKSNPGTILVQVRYDYTIGDDRTVLEEAKIHPQAFAASETPNITEIDAIYEFKYSANGKEIHLLRVPRK